MAGITATGLVTGTLFLFEIKIIFFNDCPVFLGYLLLQYTETENSRFVHIQFRIF